MLPYHGVIHLGDGEADFLVAVDQGNDLQLQDDILKSDVGADTIRVRKIADTTGGYWNPSAGGDHRLFVVRRIDSRPAEYFEALGGLQRPDKTIHPIRDLTIKTQPGQRPEGCGMRRITQIGHGFYEGLTRKKTAGKLALPTGLELPEIVHAKFESIIQGELANDGSKVNLGRLLVQSVEQTGYFSKVLRRAVGDQFVGLDIGDEPGFANQHRERRRVVLGSC